VADALAPQYAGRAVFLEQNVDVPVGDRYSRFQAAYGTGVAYLPLVIVDSGHQLMTGDRPDFRPVFQRMVELELVRPPSAEIEAYARTLGTKVRVYARLHNTSGVTLSAGANKAELHALVYEDARVGVTGRITRAAPWAAIAIPVPPDGTLTATLDTIGLSGVNFNALHTVVAADYVPGPGSTYDMLQAAVAQPAGLTVDPPSFPVGIDSGHPAGRSVAVSLAGPYNLTWTAAPDVPWLSVSPDGGAIAVAPTVTVSANGLVAGSQEGHVTLSATSTDGMAFTQFVAVKAVLGPRVFRAVAPPVSPGSPAAVPIVLSALGDEHAVAFSLAFDAAMVRDPAVALGSAAQDATLAVDTTQSASGHVGVTVTLPAGRSFPHGDCEIAVVTFATAAVVPRQAAAVVFCDQPVERDIADAFGNGLTAELRDATLAFPEGSVMRVPRRHVTRPAG